ncbi:MAG: hypothetical protein CVU14_09705 [Bacteroidetes bacterium HGW-Bacteroidetes-9]|nr:MAG: hypothetical protein CVU14_09705 [Bacteroidetes bacterium HGW-Bacteroidetes-9]
MKIRSILAILVWLSVCSLSNAQGIPAGYYDQASGLTGPQLKTALQKIVRNHTVKSYTYLWTAFYTSDDKSNGKVWDMYSDVPGGTLPYEYTFGTNQCATTPGYEGACYNREHTFPASYFGGGTTDTIYTDLFHLIPADSHVNTNRNNYPYGVVGVATWTSMNGSKRGPCISPGYSGTVFEPIDDYKGDVARNYFYVATRYENSIASWENNTANGDVVLNGTSFPCFEPWFLTMLGEWHTNDPVSQKEIDRNNTVYGIQGNRNPFIDHPEYVYEIWGVGAPNYLPEPSNYPASFSAHNIQLQWVDATGDILPDGYLVRMSSTGFSSISDPVDGTVYPDNLTDQNIAYGIQNTWFKSLNPNTTYYFKLFSYTGEGSARSYKTDGGVPQLQQTTTP